MDLGLEAVPRGVMIKEVLLKLDMQTLCSVACVSKALRFSVSEVLRLLSSLHLSVTLSLLLQFQTENSMS